MIVKRKVKMIFQKNNLFLSQQMHIQDLLLLFTIMKKQLLVEEWHTRYIKEGIFQSHLDLQCPCC